MGVPNHLKGDIDRLFRAVMHWLHEAARKVVVNSVAIALAILQEFARRSMGKHIRSLIVLDFLPQVSKTEFIAANPRVLTRSVPCGMRGTLGWSFRCNDCRHLLPRHSLFARDGRTLTGVDVFAQQCGADFKLGAKHDRAVLEARPVRFDEPAPPLPPPCPPPPDSESSTNSGSSESSTSSDEGGASTDGEEEEAETIPAAAAAAPVDLAECAESALLPHHQKYYKGWKCSYRRDVPEIPDEKRSWRN